MSDLRQSPPPRANTLGVAEYITPSHRERDDTYSKIVTQCRDNWRIIRASAVCNGSFKRGRLEGRTEACS